MKFLNAPSLLVGCCVLLGLATKVFDRTMYALGRPYWIALAVLGIVHLVTSTEAVRQNAKKIGRICIIVLAFLLGQMWAIQMFYMLVAWKLSSFV